MNSLRELYIDQLRDIYSAEAQLVAALPKMALAAYNPELQQSFEHHLAQTRQHIKRLDQIFADLGIPAEGDTCEAMQGLVKESEKGMQKSDDVHVRDAALIAASQRVEHYEIAAYGTVCTYALQLRDFDAYILLHETLSEEKATDDKLTRIATTSVNALAQA